MTTLRDVIHKKGSEVFSIQPDASVFEALKLMADKNTGAILVRSGSQVAGILSERDCVRRVDLYGRTARETKVKDIMTSKVLYVQASQTLEECVAVMIDKSIRHMPVPPELRFNEADIERVIRDSSTHARAAEALAQIRLGREGEIPSAEGLDTAAALVGEDRAQFWVATLKRKNSLATFVAALRMRGLAIETWSLSYEQTLFPDEKLAGFLARARSFRCKVRVVARSKAPAPLSVRARL